MTSKKNGHSELLQMACKSTCCIYTCSGYTHISCLTLHDIVTWHVQMACKSTCCIYTCSGYTHISCLTLHDIVTWHDHHVCSVLPSLMNYNSLLEMEVDSDTCGW